MCTPPDQTIILQIGSARQFGHVLTRLALVEHLPPPLLLLLPFLGQAVLGLVFLGDLALVGGGVTGLLVVGDDVLLIRQTLT